MTKYFVSIVVFACMFLGLCCKDNGITPIEEVKPGRRDYKWFIDTIYAGGNYINGINGVSSNDVWVISNPGDFSQTFYHFDGMKWSTDGANRSIAPEAIRAFASNDVWAVGLGGDIWHYNGTSWNRHTKIPSPNTNYYSLASLDGNISTNLYAVGNLSYTGSDLRQLIYHLNSGLWSRIDIPDSICSLIKIRFYAPGKALILGGKYAPDGSAPDTSKIFTFDGNNLHEIYSAHGNYLGKGNFATIPGGVIISKGMKLTFFDGTSEIEIITIKNDLFRNGLEARSVKDIFLGMNDGVAHYNGSDIQYLLNFSNSNYFGILIEAFENSVFIAANDRNLQKIIVFRGYLK